LSEADSGSEGVPVVIGSYGEGRATIDAGDGQGLSAVGCSHLLIRGLDFVGSGRKDGNTESGVTVRQAEHVEVNQVEVHGFQKSGVLVAGCRKARVTNVYAHDNGFGGITVGGDYRDRSEDVYIGYCVAENNPGDPTNLDNHSGNGIVVGYVSECLIEHCEAMENGWDMPREGNGPVGIWAHDADRVVIQFCIAHDNKSPGYDGGGFDFDGAVTNSILQYNLSFNNVGPGYFMCQYGGAGTWKDNIIRYNISQNDGSKSQNCGIMVWYHDGMSDAEIYNNTVYHATGAAVGLENGTAPGMLFRSNILISGADLILGSSDRARFEGNIYWSVTEDGLPLEGCSSFDEWAEKTGQEQVDGEVVGRCIDPQLVGIGEATLTDPRKLAELIQYRLRADSPCIGAGMPIGDDGGRDFWGNPLPEEGKPSVGACEKP
ncbi:MAG: right-handed parallel beta-helix repeat-containing protein, partial [Planctomycetota bacterium]